MSAGGHHLISIYTGNVDGYILQRREGLRIRVQSAMITNSTSVKNEINRHDQFTNNGVGVETGFCLRFS